MLRGTIDLEADLGRVVASLSEWASLVAHQGLNASTNDLPDLCTAFRVGVDGITDCLIESVPLLGKSLQEAPFFGADFGLTRTLFAETLTASLRHENADVLVRGFLALHVFNAAWFRSAESFRTLAGTPEAYVQHMEDVESACYRAVDSAWKALGIRCPMSVFSAEQLIDEIGVWFCC
jgi:hypothetical protein